MGPTVQQLKPGITRKLQVNIGSVGKELKLQVKIDKSCVSLPGEDFRERPENREEVEKYEVADKVDRIGPYSDAESIQRYRKRLHRCRTNSAAFISCKPVDTTLLCILAEYASLPLTERKRLCATGRDAAELVGVASAPYDREEDLCPHSSEEREDGCHSDCGTQIAGRGSHAPCGFKGRPDFEDYFPMPHSGYLSKMEHVTDDPGPKEHQTNCSELQDLGKGQEMAAAFAAVNNNLPRDEEQAPVSHAELLEGKNAGISRSPEELLAIRLGNQNDCLPKRSAKKYASSSDGFVGGNGLANNDRDITSDQIVPQVPRGEHIKSQLSPNRRNGTLEQEQMDSSVCVVQENKETGMQEKAPSESFDQGQSHMKDDDDGKYLESRKTNGYGNTCTRFTTGLQKEPSIEPGGSTNASIGERVDDEIKALLEGVGSRSEGVMIDRGKGDLGVLLQEGSSSAGLGTGSGGNMEDNNTGVMRSKETVLDDELGEAGGGGGREGTVEDGWGATTIRRDAENVDEEQSGEEGSLVCGEPMKNDAQASKLTDGKGQDEHIVKLECRSETENEPSVDNFGESVSEEHLNPAVEEQAAIQDGRPKGNENALVSHSGDKPDDQSTCQTDFSTKSDTDDSHVSRSTDHAFQSDSTGGADHRTAMSDGYEEHKVGRKGLKQLQSQSLLEAEITSEQTEVIPATTSTYSAGADVDHVFIQDQKSPVSDVYELGRSQSVIVSNPRNTSGGRLLSDDNSYPSGTTSETVKESQHDIRTTSNDECIVERSRDEASKQTPSMSETTSEHPELFQALTPPPPSSSIQDQSNSHQPRTPMVHRTSEGPGPPGVGHPGIQITSIRTLAPLTNRGRAPSTVGEREVMLVPRMAMASPDESTKRNVILQGPPVASFRKMVEADHLHLLDLSKEGGSRGQAVADDRGKISVHDTDPRASVSQYVPGMQESSLVQGAPTDEEKQSAIDYNHKEHQQYFMEIKKHLLTSKANVTTPNELGPILRMVPVSMNGQNSRPVISVAPVTNTETLSAGGVENNGSYAPSPLGQFSGAMMEHVKHWKEQNEMNSRPQNQPSAPKLPQNIVPVEASGPHVVYPTMVPPHHVTPLAPMDHPANLVKNKKSLETPSTDINHGLLENLQALHKMYFKSMNGGEKVILSKVSPKKPASPLTGPMSEMVQVVKPFMPPLMQSQMMPRFPPPDGQITPELLNYHMNVVARNVPGLPPISPSAQKAFQPRMISPGIFPEQHQLNFPNVNARFPRPLPISEMEHLQKRLGGTSEVMMVPPKAIGQFPLSSRSNLGGKPHSVPRELMRPRGMVTTVSPQGVPMMLLPPGVKFPPEEVSMVNGPIALRKPMEVVSPPAAKRKAVEGSPLDLSTISSKIRRVNSSDELPIGDQPIDLSVKMKAVNNNKDEINTSTSNPIPTMDGKMMPLPPAFGFLPPNSLGVPSNSQMPANKFPPNFLVPPQYLGAHLQGFPTLPTPLPLRMQQSLLNNSKPQMILPHTSLSSTSPRAQLPYIDPRHRMPPVMDSMPTPDQVEMMKLVVGNNDRLIRYTSLPPAKRATALPPSAFPGHPLPQTMANGVHPGDTGQPMGSEADLELSAEVKRKRGRPKGSTNKKRYPPVIRPQLPLQESPAPATVPAVSPPSEIVECQFCDFKAASRGDVRQHVKVVHFAKFRKDSGKIISSCDALTATSDYVPPRHATDLPPNVKVGEWTTIPDGEPGNQSSSIARVSPQNHGFRPTTPSDLETSSLVIDVSGSAHDRIKEEGQTPAREDIMPHPSDIDQNISARSTEQEHDTGGERQDKPPLKITLRRVSAPRQPGGERNTGMFSSLHQEKSPPEKKPKFICQTCGASYNYVNGLREHESRHRVDLPFECGVCHLKYKTQGMLSRHQAQKNHQAPQ